MHLQYLSFSFFLSFFFFADYHYFVIVVDSVQRRQLVTIYIVKALVPYKEFLFVCLL